MRVIQARPAITSLAMVALLAACSSLPEREVRNTTALLQQIAASASGDFATSLDETDPALLLTVAPEPMVSNSRSLVLNLTQQAPETQARRFRLTLTESAPAAPNPLSGTLAPLGLDGRAVARCPLTVRTGSMGVSAETSAASCQFGPDDRRMGLAKELLFDGRQVRVADRLVRLTGAEAEELSLTELRFFRLDQYSGWIGVPDGDRWRIARDVRIDTANGSIEPVDAAGMSLGVIVQLDQTMLADSPERTILRLTVLDAVDERTLGRSWSESGADRIGLATPEVQIGLERSRTP